MKISACVIAKNEEKNLPRLLHSISGKFDEIIVVDTGSTDRTVEIARSYGCKTFRVPWRGFASARNEALKGVSEDSVWVWHFDADFELEEEEFKKALYYLKIMPEEIDGLFVGVKNLDKVGAVKGVSAHIFLHRNKSWIRWEGRVHEYPTVKMAVGIPVFVNHYGYADSKIQFLKALRNLSLLREELQSLKKSDRGKYLKRLFFLLQTLTILSYDDGRFLEEAIKVSEEFFSLSKGFEEELGFFYSYALNYYLLLLQLKGDREKLHFVFSRDFDKVSEDFLFYKVKFLVEEERYGEAFDILLVLAEKFSVAEENPFFGGRFFVSDCILGFRKFLASIALNEKFWREIDSERRKLLENRFKRTKAKFLGFLYSVSKRDWHLLKKLALRFQDPLFLGALEKVGKS